MPVSARVALFLLLAAAVVQNAALAQSATGSLTGRVIDAETGAPIAGAMVTLSAVPVSPLVRPMNGQTNAEGVFLIVGIPEGRRRVAVQKTGYFLVGGSQQAPVIDITAAGVAETELQLDRGGAIAGRVVDANGNRISDVSVGALPRRQPGDRAPGLAMVSPTTQSNDLGEFRLAGLPPGEYYLIARARPGPLTSAAAPTATVLVPTYYPDVTDMARATPLVVRRGVTTQAHDLKLLALAVYAVSGVVVHADGRPAPGANVLLVPAPRTGTPRGSPLATTARADGTFRIVNVPVGTYLIDATLANKLERIRTPPSLVVESAHVTGVKVVVRP